MALLALLHLTIKDAWSKTCSAEDEAAAAEQGKAFEPGHSCWAS